MRPANAYAPSSQTAQCASLIAPYGAEQSRARRLQCGPDWVARITRQHDQLSPDGNAVVQESAEACPAAADKVSDALDRLETRHQLANGNLVTRFKDRKSTRLNS